MTDTVIGGSSGDAVKYPHDEGLPNISDGNETWGSAGYLMALGQAVDGGSYARSDSELTFTGHDGTNDQVDVTAGIAYLDLSGESVNVQSTLGGSSPPSYDTALPTLPSIMVVVPTTVTNLDVTDSTLNDFWLAYATDGSVTGVSAGDIYIRHGSGLSAPPHPSVKLGQANPDDSTADVLENRGGSPSFNTVNVKNGITSGSVSTGDLSATNALVWAEDDNSPLTISNSSTGQITLNDTYDWVTCFVQDSSDNGTPISVRVNGDSGSNYFYRETDGSSTANASEWPQVANDSGFSGQRLSIAGRWSGDCGLFNQPLVDSSRVISGNNSSVISPLDSITFLNTTGTNFDATVHVYGHEKP